MVTIAVAGVADGHVRTNGAVGGEKSDGSATALDVVLRTLLFAQNLAATSPCGGIDGYVLGAYWWMLTAQCWGSAAMAQM